MPILTFSLPLDEVELGGESMATALTLPSALIFSSLAGGATVRAFRVLRTARLGATALH